MNLVPHAENVARRKLAPLPQGWTVCSWKQSGKDGIVISGGVPRPMSLWGGRVGKLFEGEPQSVLVSFAEIRIELLRYELETGKCGECLGSGRMPARDRRYNATRAGICPRCSGAKRAPPTTREVAHAG